MLIHYLRIAFRGFRHRKLFTFINATGIAIGMASCILIALFIQEQLRYDSFHTKGDRVYRIVRESSMAGSGKKFQSGTSATIIPDMLGTFPEIEAGTRFFSVKAQITYGDRQFFRDFCLVDASILEMFDFQMMKGDREAALNGPNKVIITEKAAKLFFAGEDPIGKIITVNDYYLEGSYIVTGVLKDISNYSHVQFDFLTAHLPSDSSKFLKRLWNEWELTDSFRPFTNYIMLPEDYNSTKLEAKLPEFIGRHLPEKVADSVRYHLQPLNRIHLYSKIDYGLETETDTDILYIYQLGSIGILVLLIACVNFMSLATAQSAMSAREVGMRKVVGAGRLQLIIQFLSQSFLLTMIASILACGIAAYALPFFNEFTGVELVVNLDNGLVLIVGLAGLVSIVGLIAGSYPAFFLSSFMPVETLKGTSSTKVGNAVFRKALVVFQFAVSGALIISSIIIYHQTEFMKEKDVGYNKEQLIYMQIYHQKLSADKEVVKRTFLDHPNVLKATICHPALGWNVAYHVVRPEGEWEGEWEMQVLGIDEDFLDTFEIELISGRNLDRSIPTDSQEAFLINETAARSLGWDEPIGKRMEWLPHKSGYVVGVVRDFHTQSLHSPIEPVLMHDWIHMTLAVRIRGENIPETLAHLEKQWLKFLPDTPFYYEFVAGDWAYESEIQLIKICTFFAALAVFVACLGLFGLTSYATERRTKEIGIRKVLGGTVYGLVVMLSIDFVKLVAIANVIAWPVAYYVMASWLQKFPYRIDLTVEPFVLCGALTLLVVLATVSYQTIRASLANPVDALRYE
jgi:putative ABC transport system permease protein